MADLDARKKAIRQAGELVRSGSAWLRPAANPRHAEKTVKPDQASSGSKSGSGRVKP